MGIQLPDITFQANFAAVTELKNNDTIQTNAYISGSGDNRAYDQAKGNTDNVTVGIVISGGTNLIKAVNTNFIEQDGTITYTVTYANSGEEPVNKVYFYDLLSNNSDIRNSKFNGEIILRSFNLTTEGGGQHASATVYFSTTDYGELYDNVKVFGGEWNKDTGKAQGMDTGNVEKMLNEGTNDKGDHLFYMLGYVNDEGKFQYLDEFQKMEESEISELMESVTGIYVKAEQLTSKQSIQMTFTVETDGNKATNQYNNIANSWIADSKTSPLTSNQVETGVVGRSISGVVWADDNLNGLRDDGELLLKDVTATLFKKDDNTGGYVKCTEDVTYKKPKETKGGTEGGADIVGKSDAETASSEEGKIEPVVTKTDGAYSFDKLAAGDYIVAFSGDALESYTAATVYQHQGATDISNDGVALSELGNVEGIDSDKYAYAIKYSVNSPSMTLNTINEMVKKNIYEQAFEHQDLGLVKASHKLPETGGIGAVWYVLTGAVLVTGAGFLYAARRRKKQKPIR